MIQQQIMIQFNSILWYTVDCALSIVICSCCQLVLVIYNNTFIHHIGRKEDKRNTVKYKKDRWQRTNFSHRQTKWKITHYHSKNLHQSQPKLDSDYTEIVHCNTFLMCQWLSSTILITKLIRRTYIAFIKQTEPVGMLAWQLRNFQLYRSTRYSGGTSLQ